MADEQEVHITLTGKSLNLVALILASLVGWYPLANILTPNVRHDPFTGAQGADLQRQIDDLKQCDTRMRKALTDHIREYNQRVIKDQGIIQRHEAQILELYRRVP